MVQFETHEFHMLTSATLIEALYECVDDWLKENTRKTNILDLDPEDWIVHDSLKLGHAHVHAAFS